MMLDRRKTKYIDGVLHRLCACGKCGRYLKAHKDSGREVKFIPGHNTYGRIPWNKYLTKETDERVMRVAIALAISDTEKGPRPSCLCGCGRGVSWNRHKRRWYKFIHGHNNIGKKYPKERVNKVVMSLALYYDNQENRNRVASITKKVWQRKGFKESRSGENHHAWLKDRSKISYPSEWTKELKRCIRKRDGYICQLCLTSQDKLNRKLDVHHIDYDKNNCDEENLISLCVACHRKTGFHRQKWMSIFASQ